MGLKDLSICGNLLLFIYLQGLDATLEGVKMMEGSCVCHYYARRSLCVCRSCLVCGNYPLFIY